MYFEMLFSEGTNVVSQLSLKYGSDNRVTAVQQGDLQERPQFLPIS